MREPLVATALASTFLLLGLLARAVAEFKHVGFFKTVRDSRFARLDSWAGTPLGLALSPGVAWVASR